MTCDAHFQTWPNYSGGILIYRCAEEPPLVGLHVLSGKFWSGKNFGLTGSKFSEIIKNFGPPSSNLT